MHERYVRTAFDGEGARRAGGRFNSKGTPVVYTADSLALTMLEVSFHLPSYRQLLERVAIPVRFDERHVKDVGELPTGWNASPVPPVVQIIGDRWQRSGRSFVLRAPSVIVPRAFNYVINREHPDFGELEIGEPEPCARRLLDIMLESR